MALFIGRNTRTTDLIACFGGDDYIKELISKYLSPKIGDLRYQTAFVNISSTLVQNADNVYIPTHEFDGWAYPNGIRLRREDFPEAAAMYDSTGSDTFALPNLNHALRAVGSVVDSLNAFSVQTSIPNHTHGVTNKIDGTVDASDIKILSGLAFISSGGTGSKNWTHERYVNGVKAKLPRFHNGKVKGGSRPVPLDVTVKLNELKYFFEDGTTKPYPLPNPDPVPQNYVLPHYDVPIMIYIGKPHKSSDEPLDTFTVRFYSDSSKTELLASCTVTYGHDATPPSNPTKPGHRFLRWNGAYTNVTHDVDVYAEWEAIPTTCIVTWNGNGGSNKGTTTVEKGQAIKTAISTLPTSTRTGYTQNKWWTASSGGSEVTLNTVVNNSLTAYAHWTANPVEPSLVMIRFNANGGNISSTEIERIVWGYTGQQFSTIGGLGSFTFPIPTKPGYDFDGWYTESTGGTKIELHTLIPNVAEVTYYAHWKSTDITITFVNEYDYI